MQISAGVRRKSVCGPGFADIVAVNGEDIHHSSSAKAVRLF
jgi:hypothetical protein